VFDTQSSGYSEGAIVGLRVMVLDEDLAEAAKLLREYER
jgi:predicted esterase